MSNKKYFLDANVIIDLLDKGTKPQEEANIIQRLEDLNFTQILEDETSKIFISSFIRLEVLRSIVDEDRFNKAKEILNLFTRLEDNNTKKIINETINFSRFCKKKGVTNKIGAMDYIHFITAKYYDYEILSSDKHLKTLEEQYKNFPFILARQDRV